MRPYQTLIAHDRPDPKCVSLRMIMLRHLNCVLSIKSESGPSLVSPASTRLLLELGGTAPSALCQCDMRSFLPTIRHISGV